MFAKYKRILTAIVASSLMLLPAVASASLTPSFSQTINAGSITADIYQSNDTTPVAAPTVAFSPVNYSFSCQTSTGTLGDSNDKLNVTNLASGVSNWNIAIAATAGPTATWSSGSSTYSYNNAAGSPAGCTSGELTVNPSVATKTDDCNSSCTANDSTVSLGASTVLNNATSTNSATLMSDTAGTPWEGYITGISLSQQIPALQASGAYTLPMTITLTHA